MEMYNLNDEPSTYAIHKKDYVWVATDYKLEWYAGQGEAVALREDGLLDIYESLGHCSCYGPFENTVLTVTQEEYLREKDSVLDWRLGAELDTKVRELLNESN